MAPARSIFLAATPGGTLGRYFRGVVAELGRRGHEVHWLVPPVFAGAAREVQPSAVVHPWSPPPWWRPRDPGLDALFSTVRPAAVVASFAGTNVLLSAARRHGVPARVTWHHTPSGQLLLDGAGRLRWAVSRRRKSFFYRHATNVLVATEHVAEDVQRAYGVARDDIVIEPYAIPAPHRHDGDPVPGRVVFVGRFNPSKGHDWLLRSLPEVARAVPDLELRMTGHVGPTSQPARELIAQLGLESHCRFLGQIGREELEAEVASAAVAVVPSLDEGFGLVTIEAEGAGTPVVGSDIPPSRVTVADGISGLLVPTGDSSAMAAALVDVLSDPELRARLSAGARRHFDEHFDLATRVGPIVDTYERVLFGG